MNIANDVTLGAIFGEGSTVTPADKHVSGIQDLEIALRYGHEALRVNVFRLHLCLSCGNVEFDQEAACVSRRISFSVGVVVEYGQAVGALPASIVLPGEIHGSSVRSIGEIVVLSTQGPKHLAGISVHTGDCVCMSPRNEVMTPVVFVDTVQVVVIESPRAFMASVSDREIAALRRVKLGGTPLEEQLTRRDVDLLEDTVVEPAQLGTANSC